MNPHENSARIGPNAIVQVVAALVELHGLEPATALLEDIGLGSALDSPPTEMVAEADVIALHGAVRHHLGSEAACRVLARAGSTTGDYLLAHRIPAVAQRLLRILPASLASRALLGAIARHSWTFAGSGTCSFRPGHPVRIEILDCPACRGVHATAPACDYYAHTFERLYRVLVARSARVVETDCIAAGADACRFEIRWGD